MSRFEPASPDSTTESAPSHRFVTGSRTRNLVTASLVVSLLAVSAWVTLPLGAVPVTLQVFVVVLAALLLSPGWAAASLGTYLLLGAAGLPIFSHGTGGIGVVAGPTGGYLIGFFVAAPLAAMIRVQLRRRGVASITSDIAAAITCIVCIYLLGWTQLALVTGMGPAKAFLAGVLPFLIPDAIKAAVAITVATAVRRARAL